MENYELIITAPPKRKNGHFPKGHIPFNKGIPMDEWMDGRKKRRVLKYLEIGRKRGNPSLPGNNRKAIVGIKDGKLFPFPGITDAARILRTKGIKISARNINSVCAGKTVKVGKYSYVRKKAGGFRWFYANDIEKYSKLLNYASN